MAIDPVNREGLEQLLRRSCREVELRVRAGEDLVSEAILSNFPELAADAELAIDLIYTEYVTREELGQKPSAVELITRFPQWSDRLERLLDVDAALGDVRPESLTVLPKSTWEGDPKSITTHGPNPPSPIRRRIGQYEILQEIGRGGMGVVYRARQLGLNRIVALKVIQAAQVSPGQQSRFRTEAMAIAQLTHPNIVRVIEIGEQDDSHFISLEYAADGSLDRKLLSGPYAIRAAAEVVETLARAVDYAHDMGIIHRDLKPGNVLLSAGGVLKVADFGLAKWYLAPTSEQTQSGALLGTPCYMAPEQAGGRANQIGPATDIYALGVILYELLVGSPPFLTDSAIETMEKIRMEEPPSPRRSRKSVPRDLETICLRCLQKDPRRRFNSAKDLADDLHRFLEHEPIQSRSIRSSEKMWRWVRRHALATTFTMVMLLMCLAGAIFLMIHRQEVDDLSTDVKLSTRRVKVSEQIAATAKSEAENTIKQATEVMERLSREGQQLMWQAGFSDLGEKSLDQVLTYYEDLLKRVPNDVGIQRRAAHAYVVVGQFQRERGQIVAAEKNIRKGIDLWTHVSQQYPKDLDVKSGLAAAVMHLATLDRALERTAESEAHYREGTRILDELIALAPHERKYKHQLATGLLNLAVPLRRRGKLAAAEQEVRRAIEITWQGIEQSLQAAGVSPEDQELFYQNGQLATDSATSAQASRVLPDVDFLRELSSKVLKTLINEGWVSQLGLGYEDVGMAWERQGYIKDAERVFQQAFDIRQLALSYGGAGIRNLEFMARSHWTLARSEYRHGEPIKAEAHLRESIILLTGLDKDYPKWAAFSNGIAVNETMLGKSLRLRGQYDESETTLRRAVKRYESLYQVGQVSSYTRFGLSAARHELGLTLHDQGKFNEAILVMKQAVLGQALNMHAVYDLAYCLSLAPDFQYRHELGLCPIAKPSLIKAEEMRQKLHPQGKQKNLPAWKRSLRRISRGNNLDRTLEALLAWHLRQPVRSVQLLGGVLQSIRRDINRYLLPKSSAKSNGESVVPAKSLEPKS